MFERALPILIAVATTLSACGSPTPYPEDNGLQYGDPQTIEVPVAIDRQGSASSDGLAGLSPNLIPIGDTNDATVHRALLGFPLDAIPEGAQIIDASLIVYLNTEVGSPHEDLGRLFVDLVDFGAAIDASDFSEDIMIWGASLLSDVAGEGPRMADVNVAISEAMRLGLPAAEFRLRFEIPTNVDGGTDLAFINGTEDLAQSGVTPLLSITYAEKVR